MNYLSHIFLSGSDRNIQIGNFIGDAVKGGSYKDYPPSIAYGIQLHRAIDDYTDSHPAIKELIRPMKPHFGRYSAVLLDIYFDYLLASHFSELSDMSLKQFARRFYFTMIRCYLHLPARFKRFMWHFILTNRLCRYAAIDGIRESLQIMVTYGRINISVDKAIDYLIANEKELWAVFSPFIHELQALINGCLMSSPSSNPQSLLNAVRNGAGNRLSSIQETPCHPLL